MSDAKISDDYAAHPISAWEDTDIFPVVRQGAGSPPGYQNAAGTLVSLRRGLLGDYTSYSHMPLRVNFLENGVEWAPVDLSTAAVTGILPSANLPRTEVFAYDLSFAVGDEVSAITTGTKIVTLRPPNTLNITSALASLNVPQSAGSILTIDIKQAFPGNTRSSIFSTLLTIDNTEYDSSTASTQAVLISNPVTVGFVDEISVDITQVGNGTAVGLKVYLLGYR